MRQFKVGHTVLIFIKRCDSARRVKRYSLMIRFEVLECRLGSDQFAIVMPCELFGLKLFLSSTHNFINQLSKNYHLNIA